MAGKTKGKPERHRGHKTKGKPERHRGHKELVFGVLKRFANQHVTTDELMTETGLSRQQIQGACAYLVKSPDLDVVRVSNSVWMYRPGASKGGTLFAQIGQTREGKLLLEGEDGAIYLAEML